jgi:flavin reductase (DIM6/NTAB) family NADH-FMN oxidoreductase RutF
MGEAGLLPGGVDGSVGWRVTGEYRRLGRRPMGSTKGEGILQLLSPKQSKLVPILGKMPGWDEGALMKKKECVNLGHEWVVVGSNDEEFDVLPNCASYLQIKLKRVTDGGDHDVCIVQVVKTGVWDDVNKTVIWLEVEGDQQPAFDATTALYSGQLRDEGII